MVVAFSTRDSGELDLFRFLSLSKIELKFSLHLQARNFYNIWSGFTTEKSFDWVDPWESERGEDRRVRR